MGAINIYVEGNADVKFLSDYVEYLGLGQLSKSIEIKNNTAKASLKKNDGANVFINGIGGWTNVQNVLPNIQSTLDDGGKVLVVFDADSEPDTRREEILDLLGKGLVNSSDVFLFPDNQQEGDLETLLENIIVDNNKFVFCCWSKFMDCLTKNDREQKMRLPNRKAKIFDYVSLLGRKAQEKDRNYKDSSLWNLDAPYLEPLRDFLVSALDSSQNS